MAEMVAAFLGLGLAAGLQVVAEGGCPTAAAVEAYLAPLLPPAASTAGLRARIEPIDELLRVEVRSAEGAQLTVRDLLRDAPCTDLAAAAAVVIASAIGSSPRPPVLPVLPPPRPPVRDEDLDTPTRPHRRPRTPMPFEVGLGAAAALAAPTTQWAAGGVLLAQVAPPGSRLGAHFMLLGMGLRSLPVFDGSADWTRVQFAVGPRYRLLPWMLLVDLQASGLLALVHVEGHGFPFSYRSEGLDVGIGGGVRLGVRLGPVLPWLAMGVAGWLRPQHLKVLDQPGQERLPSFDLVLSAGVSVGRW